MKPTVYIETTIVSYLTSWPSRDVIRLGHQIVTRNWWEKSRDFFDLRTSDLVVQEASAGEPNAARERLKALTDLPRLSVDERARVLAERLAIALALPSRARLDAAHVAIAAVHKIEFLLTWNCRHLANAALASKIERSCAAFGQTAPRIVTPEQLMESP